MTLRQRQPRQTHAGHLAWLRTLPSVVPGAGPVDAAHIRYGDPRYAKPSTGMGEKPSDRWCLPLAHDVHMAQHGRGERAWWGEQGIDPIIVAAFLRPTAATMPPAASSSATRGYMASGEPHEHALSSGLA